MNRLDTYYRAHRQYRKDVEAKRQCKAENHAVATSDIRLDRIVFERKKCEIDPTWIDEIEKGLVFVEKAIKEERQFIRSNGEVIQIEKVKSVSKTSVEHLARHSNLITRVTEGEDLIPDKLYTVEKLSDYAVYENRFLYMLLCYLRDFITLRYNKILDISNTYNASMSMSKSVKTEKETVIYKVELFDTRRDDEYLTANNSAQELIDRIDLLLKTVSAFLATPLMEMVAKAPMLKPPITKTNVLKMNNNFKGAMALYGFVTSYEGDGYTVYSETKEITPFEPEFAEEMANSVTLAAFLTYKRALNIESELNEAYLEEEKRRKDEELQKRLEKIESLRRRLKNKEITPEEYIIDVEKALREYEKRLRDFNKTAAKLAETENNLEESLKREKHLEAENQRYLTELQEQKIAYENQISEINTAHANEIERINTEHKDELERIDTEHREELERIDTEHREEIEALHNDYKEQLTALTEEYETKMRDALAEMERDFTARLLEKDGEIAALKEKYDADTTALNAKIGEQLHTIAEQKESNQRLTDERRITEAKLLSLKSKTGNITEDDSYITEDRFDELENILATFKRFYREEWAKAKKKIRRDYLWNKKNGKDGKALPEESTEAENAEELTENAEVPSLQGAETQEADAKSTEITAPQEEPQEQDKA